MPEDKLIEAMAREIERNPLNPEVAALATLAAIEQAGYVVARGWQPIETAPKDGAGRGLYGSETMGPEVLLRQGSAIYIGFWNGHSWDDGDFNSDMGQMTAWMPLPALPKAPSNA
jgi:hypothetical protein